MLVEWVHKGCGGPIEWARCLKCGREVGLKDAVATTSTAVRWRVGREVPLNVYAGDRPVCQCHRIDDAERIVAAVNAIAEQKEESQPREM